MKHELGVRRATCYILELGKHGWKYTIWKPSADLVQEASEIPHKRSARDPVINRIYAPPKVRHDPPKMKMEPQNIKRSHATSKVNGASNMNRICQILWAVERLWGLGRQTDRRMNRWHRAHMWQYPPARMGKIWARLTLGPEVVHRGPILVKYMLSTYRVYISTYKWKSQSM